MAQRENRDAWPNYPLENGGSGRPSASSQGNMRDQRPPVPAQSRVAQGYPSAQAAYNPAQMPDRQSQPQAQDPGGAYLQNGYGEGGDVPTFCAGSDGSAGVGLRGCFLLPYAAGERERVWATVRPRWDKGSPIGPSRGRRPPLLRPLLRRRPNGSPCRNSPSPLLRERCSSKVYTSLRRAPIKELPILRVARIRRLQLPREERLGLPVSHGVILPSVLRPMIQKKRVALFKIQSPALRNKARAVRPRRLFCAVWG